MYVRSKLVMYGHGLWNLLWIISADPKAGSFSCVVYGVWPTYQIILVPRTYVHTPYLTILCVGFVGARRPLFLSHLVYYVVQYEIRL